MSRCDIPEKHRHTSLRTGGTEIRKDIYVPGYDHVLEASTTHRFAHVFEVLDDSL